MRVKCSAAPSLLAFCLLLSKTLGKYMGTNAAWGPPVRYGTDWPLSRHISPGPWMVPTLNLTCWLYTLSSIYNELLVYRLGVCSI
ncbi:hypothetical protein F5X96DRAFT_5821 [Biscogniauxia mediterranea]|nr:hypothetical protein F5X96DRAFT_5821 [Biscogniauxia mediterranea]